MAQSARRTACILTWLAIASLVAPAIAASDRPVANRDELELALRQATPGTRILLAPGTYPGGIAAAGLRGTEEQPIIIAAVDPDDPPVIEGGGSGGHSEIQFYGPGIIA